jgi:hypothetical protein
VPIVINEEDVLPIAATLRNMVRHARQQDAGKTRHAGILPLRAYRVRK